MNVRFEGNNGHDADVTRRLLMTRGGRSAQRSSGRRICDGVDLQIIGRLARIIDAQVIFDLELKSCRFVVSAGGSMVSRR